MCDFLSRWYASRLAVLPFGRKHHLLDARQRNRVEVSCHFDKDEPAIVAVLPVGVDNCVRSRAGATEEISNHI
jgi:hypothetical protein